LAIRTVAPGTGVGHCAGAGSGKHLGGADHEDRTDQRDKRFSVAAHNSSWFLFVLEGVSVIGTRGRVFFLVHKRINLYDARLSVFDADQFAKA
jgi:hypothetical protein